MPESLNNAEKSGQHLAQVAYGNNHVTNAHTQDIAQRIADYFGRDIRVSGGDRTLDENRRVHGSPKSLHLDTRGGRAIDIHIIGMTDRQAFDAIQATAHEIFDRDKAYEVIYHGKDTGTKGGHVHIGYYPVVPDRGMGYVDFKVERPPHLRTPGHEYDRQRVYLDGPTLAREAPAQSVQDIRQELIEKYKNLPPLPPEQTRIPVMELER